MSATLARSERGPLLSQLAALLGRGVPLDRALGALQDEVPKASRPALETAIGRAREGAALGATIESAGLVDGRDRAVVEAASGDQVPRALALLGDELAARESAARTLRLVFTRPAWKLALLMIFAGVLALGQILPSAYADAGSWRRGPLFQYDFYDPDPDMRDVSPLTLWTPVGRALLDATALLGGLATFALGVRLIARARVGRWFLERLGRRLPIAATMLDLDVRGTFLRAFGTALGSGQSLERALVRGQEALGGRFAATEVAPALSLAKDGAPVETCLRRVAFLDETTDWLLTSSARRPDFAREVLVLARSCEEQLLEEVARWAPLLGNLPELAVGACLLATGARTFGFLNLFRGWF